MQRLDSGYIAIQLMKNSSRRYKRVVVCLMLGGSVMVAPPVVPALVIDDFTQGALPTIQGTNTSQFGTTVVQTGLNPALVLGGTRSVFVGSLTLATARIETGKGRFHFSADNNYGYFKLDWGSVTPLDLNLSAGGEQPLPTRICGCVAQCDTQSV